MVNGYRIGEVAAKVGITVDTLRYYEKLGVLPRARRTTGGFRHYGDDVLRQLQFVRQAQALGLTLSDVRRLVGDQGRAGRDRCRKVRSLPSVLSPEARTSAHRRRIRYRATVRGAARPSRCPPVGDVP